MNRFEGKQFIITVFAVLKKHFPNFNDLLESLPDHRKRNTYCVAEIIMAGLMMFIFKRGSKKRTDQMFTTSFESNYFKFSGMRLPIMETVHKFLKELPEDELENLKSILIKSIVERKVLDKFRYLGKLVVAIDGTGVYSFDHEPFPGCPYKTSKTGKKKWYAGLLEAKIICSNGFSLSIGTEWYLNSDNVDQKQDCEQKAFVRLAQKLKKTYPRMAMIIVADSLYPNDTFFKICKINNWNFILTFKEGCLKTVWEEVGVLYSINETSNKQYRYHSNKYKETAMYINNVAYKEHDLHWSEYIKDYKEKDKKQERFVHVTDIKVTSDSVWNTCYYGRLRWKIENEGFNTQKNQGYNLKHKYSENNFTAMQNYYQLLQLAHLINQLVEKLQSVKQLLKESGRTLKSIWEDTFASMLKERIITKDVIEIMGRFKQLRY